MMKSTLGQKISINLDSRPYSLRVFQHIRSQPEIPRLAVVTFQPNQIAKKIAQICVAAIRKYTPEEIELWVLDNNSPIENIDWLRNLSWANVALNRTEPYPRRFYSLLTKFKSIVRHRPHQLYWGSYANAVGLELITKLLDADTKYLMTLHMDALPCASNWLSYLLAQINNHYVAAGMRMDRFRVSSGVLHVSALLFDYQLFRCLNLDFFPQLPTLDVGDNISVCFREAGYPIFTAKNTHSQPELSEKLPEASPFRGLSMDRAFDDDGNVIFLHFGRGLNKSTRDQDSQVSAQEWIRFIENNLLEYEDFAKLSS
jgi:hypothetical protein